MPLSRQVWLGAFLVAHAPLGVLIRIVPAIGILHQLACFSLGVGLAAIGRVRKATHVIAYIAGCEVLWRMTRSSIAWEFGKYAISAICVVGMLRVKVKRNIGLPVAYFALLLPSAILTFTGGDSAEEARQLISFNLSGPMCLMLCVLFFSNIRITQIDLRRMYFAIIGAAIGIAAVAYYSIRSVLEIEFINGSNRVMSGGFGPNQVSAILGLGVLFSLLLLFEKGLPWRLRAPLIGISVVLAVQAALTFSRGGLVLAFAALFGALLYLIRNRRTRVTLVIVGVLLAGVGKFVVIPRLEAFTKGKLSQRYTNIDSSGRTVIAGFDLEIFEDHPFVGVGPGMADDIRKDLGHFGAAHTEFTRVLAEHGILGLISELIMFLLMWRIFRATRLVSSRAAVVALLIWSLLFLLINAMRLAAPSFLMGVACTIAYSFRPRPKPVKAATS